MEIPDWYEMTERGPKFLPGVLAEHMTQNAPVFYSAEQYYCYENGVYHSITELTARNMVRDKMLTRYFAVCSDKVSSSTLYRPFRTLMR